MKLYRTLRWNWQGSKLLWHLLPSRIRFRYNFPQRVVKVTAPDVAVSREFEADLMKTYPILEKHLEAHTYCGTGMNEVLAPYTFSHYALATVSHYNVKSVYEIGTFKGTLSMLIMNYLLDQEQEDFRLKTIDIHSHFEISAFKQETQSRFAQYRQNIDVVVQSSEHYALEQKVDLTIIDGLHQPFQVYQDFMNTYKSSRYILFDDLNWNDTFRKAYKKILRKKSVREIFRVHTADYLGSADVSHCVALIQIDSGLLAANRSRTLETPKSFFSGT